jgi:predicted AlkP superfamily phosphohydrolase/phosphomutase/tetratricopeptide (TPR) repeat protein
METKRKVLLIGWDAADWEHINPLLEEGLLPNVEGLINRGVMGNLATLQPILSPMLWNSVATGKLADKHGIHGFIEPDPKNGGARPYSSISRKAKAIWNILTQSGLRSNVVGWWASHPAEAINGVVVTNAFGGVRFEPERGWIVPPGTIHPPELAQKLAPFKIFPTELTEAHLLPFIPNAVQIDQEKDPRLNWLAKVLSDNASIHAVATALLQCEEWDFTAVYYDGIDHFAHGFMPYHPPRLPWVEQADFEMYREVIRGAYRFHDLMLGRLLDLAGPETIVILCSDHGFESGAQRPQFTPREPAGPAVWHRQYGIVLIAGPGIRRDERIYGASLVDIPTTILTLFGLPIGEDMDGRPLLEIFEAPPAIERIPSWENLPGESGMHSADQELDRDQAEELMNQFAALGYIEDRGATREKQAEGAEVEAKYNLARTHLWKGEPDAAIQLLEPLVRLRPWEDRFIMQLAGAYLDGGYLRQGERFLTAAYDVKQPLNSMVPLLYGRLKIALGELETGLTSLALAEKMNPKSSAVCLHLGNVYLRLRRWEEAKSAFERALAADEENALALQGLSTVYRRLHRNQETVDAALRAVGLLHRLPQAHFNLGVALTRFGEWERARLAFETALRFQPRYSPAHRFLAALHNGAGGDPAKGKSHRETLSRLTNDSIKRRTQIAERRDLLFPLPEIPPYADRIATLLRERPDPKKEEVKSGKTFVIVSGLPRSGTSLMMQLLEAGGLPALTDEIRIADIDNPRGYYEWEPIKKIRENPELLDDPLIEGKAIKCISMLLKDLPSKHSYKVIFLTRPIEEVALSQDAMIKRLQREGAALDAAQLHRGLRAHRDEILNWLRHAPNMEFIEVDYPALITDPDSVLARIIKFLGKDRLPAIERMKSRIDPDLYRRRKESPVIAK